jgi:iron complex outermembrane recepter protein
MRGSIEKKSSKVLVLAAAVGMILPPFTVSADTDGAPSNNDPAAVIATLAQADPAVPAGTDPAAPTAGAATTSDQLATVVVTATKRTSTVQTTPMSITAVTSAEIASRGITDFDTLARSVPGLSMRASGGPGQTEFEMRGLNSQGGNSSAVGFYLGEIPLSSPAFSNLGKTVIDPDLYDLSRVEVLRGPQGTLYGSSSMGGTVRLIPNPPQLNTYAASGELVFSDTISGGNTNNRVNGMLNLPLGQRAAVRIVGSFTRDSGWLKRLVIADGAVAVDSGIFPAVSRPSNFYSAPLQESLSGVNTTTVDSIRAELLWKPTDSLTIEPTAMYQLVQQGAPNVVDVNGTPTHPETPPVKAHWEPFDTPEPQHDSFSFGSLQVTYQLPEFSLTSATGFWHRNALIAQDGTEEVAPVFGIPAYYAAAGGLGALGPEPNGPGATERDWERQLSEEFRITSTAPGPFQWLVGYFYQDLHSEFDQYLISPEAASIIGSPPIQFILFQPQVIIQNAFFGHVSWRFTPHFNVEAGFRHYHYSLNGLSNEYGVLTPNGVFGNTVPTLGPFPQQASGNLPSFTATYNINDDHMVYFNFAKGFRLGGGNVPFPVADPGTTSNPEPVAAECGVQAKLLLTTTCNPNILLQGPAQFRSDTVYSYELGAKSSFFERRMIVNLAAYYESWRDPQLPTNIAGFTLAGNGANARITGVEGQLQALLPLGFDISLNAAYTHGKFLEDSALVGFPKGTEVPDIPKVAASAVLSWNHALPDGHSLFGSLEEDYVGTRTDVPLGETITLQNINQYLVHLPAYSIVNLRFGINGKRSGGDRWTAALFVNNLTNNQVLLDPQPQTVLQLGAYTRYTITRPLTAGIDLTYQFR